MESWKERVGVVSSLVVWLILILHPLTGIHADIEEEAKALLAFKEKLTDPTNVTQSWNFDFGKNPCNWFKVHCDNGSNFVTGIFLGSSHLSGLLAANISQLKNLQFLNLFDNKISGPIPSEIGDLTNLVHLKLYSNNFNGTIPDSFVKLSSLRMMDLSNNQLSGQVSAALANLRDLHYVDLSNNRLSGEVPDAVAKMGFVDLTNNTGLHGGCTKNPCGNN